MKEEKTRSQKIRDFMSKINPNWSDLEKFIYICHNVARLYYYTFRLKYGKRKNIRAFEEMETSKGRSVDFSREIQKVLSGETSGYIEISEKVCISLSEICRSLAQAVGVNATIKEFNIGRINYHVKVGMPHNDECILVDMVNYLEFAQTDSNPLGHRVFEGISKEELLEVFENIGIDTSFPGSDLSEFLEIINRLTGEGLTPSEILKCLLKRVGERSRRYGMLLKGLSIEKYYRYLFRYLNVMKNDLIVFTNKYGTSGEYVLVTEETENKKKKYTCYLFSKEELEFKEIGLAELCKVIQRNGLSGGKSDKFNDFNGLIRRLKAVFASGKRLEELSDEEITFFNQFVL